jgi:hypothetical protein
MYAAETWTWAMQMRFFYGVQKEKPKAMNKQKRIKDNHI